MNARLKKLIFNTLRWGIAVVGIGLVVSKMTLHDRVLVLWADNRPAPATLSRPAEEGDAVFQVIDPGTGQTLAVPRDRIVNKADPKDVVLKDGSKAVVLATDLADVNATPTARRILIDDGPRGGRWVAPADTRDGYAVKVPYPRVDKGLIRMVKQADPWLLLLSVGIFPVVFVLTAYRWHELLKALDILIPWSRTFTLNMVGSFYNSFMPGSTGGDVLKAIYASKQTPHRTRAVMSVLVDRAIGLIALILLGGTMAATQWNNPESGSVCRKIALGSGLIVLGTCAGLLVFYHPTLRRYSGLDFVIKKLPMQKQVHNAVQVMEMYRRQPRLVFWSLVVTFPVHATVVASAMFAGMAFHLHIQPLSYYWAIVPVIVLSGSIPISPQGVGVMEAFAVLLTRHRGATVGEAFALTMSIRIVQNLWNLAGGFFVFKGGFHAPTEQERRDAEKDDGDDDAPAALAPAV